MKLLLAFVFICSLALSSYAVEPWVGKKPTKLTLPTMFTSTWYVRALGGTTTQCTGHTDANYPGAGTGQACAYANLQNALDAVVAGDTVTINKSDTFTGVFTLPNKSCTALSPCTVQSSGSSLLPSGRVGPSDAANMPKIQTSAAAGASVFTNAASADYWVLDGLELTDAPGVENTVQSLVYIDSNNVTIQRCYLHQKETGTGTIESGSPYHRAVIRAAQFEGTSPLMKWSYLEPFIGFYYHSVAGGESRMETTGVLCISCNGMTLEDNFLSAWWNTIFEGGGDTLPQNTANLTGATTSSATFSNTTGLSAGVMLRFEFHFTGTFNKTGLNDSCDGTFPANGSAPYSSATVTRTSGATLNSGDASHYGITRSGSDIFDGLVGICTVDGSGNITLARTRSASSTAGTVDVTVYETALVTSVVGSTVNYAPYGRDLLASNGATTVSWNYGDQGLVSNISIKKNTIYIEPTFADYVYDTSGNAPKGVMEIKSANHWVLDGNYILGYPSIIAIYPGNQYGTAPWTTAKDVTIRNNWMSPDTGYPETTRTAMSLIDASNYATVAPRKDFYVYNNLIKGGVRDFFQTKQSDNVQVYHNTVINTASATFGYNDSFVGLEAPSTNLVFRDNIVNWVLYGANCTVSPGTVGTCWPSGSFLNNVLVDVNAQGIHCGVSSEWGNGANRCPVINLFDSIPFTDAAHDIYSIPALSDYYHTATDGTSPGVDWPSLLAALANTTNPRHAIFGKAKVTGKSVAR